MSQNKKQNNWIIYLILLILGGSLIAIGCVVYLISSILVTINIPMIFEMEFLYPSYGVSNAALMLFVTGFPLLFFAFSIKNKNAFTWVEKIGSVISIIGWLMILLGVSVFSFHKGKQPVTNYNFIYLLISYLVYFASLALLFWNSIFKGRKMIVPFILSSAGAVFLIIYLSLSQTFFIQNISGAVSDTNLLSAGMMFYGFAFTCFMLALLLIVLKMSSSEKKDLWTWIGFIVTIVAISLYLIFKTSISIQSFFGDKNMALFKAALFFMFFSLTLFGSGMLLLTKPFIAFNQKNF